MPFLNLLSPTALVIAFLIATNLVAFGGWKMTSDSLTHSREQVAACRSNHEAFVAQVRVEGEAAAKKTKQVETENRRIANETAIGWASALDVVRADAARRVLRVAAAGAGGRAMPGISPPAAGVNAAAEGALPPAERVIADCAEDTLKLVWLQHWITETRETPE